MPLVRLIVVLLAGIAGAIGYLHEARRLAVIRQLTGDKALKYYEAGRARGDGLLWAVTVALCIAAAVMVVQDGWAPLTGGAP